MAMQSAKHNVTVHGVTTCQCNVTLDVNTRHQCSVNVRVTQAIPHSGLKVEHTNFSGLLDVNPLAIILQQKLMAPWSILQGNAVNGSGTEHSHASGCLQKHAITFSVAS